MQSKMEISDFLYILKVYNYNLKVNDNTIQNCIIFPGWPKYPKKKTPKYALVIIEFLIICETTESRYGRKYHFYYSSIRLQNNSSTRIVLKIDILCKWKH